MKEKEMRGVRCGRLTGVEPSHAVGTGHYRLMAWVFMCDCGGRVVRIGASVRRAVKDGRVPMCRRCQSLYSGGLGKLRGGARYRWGTELDGEVEHLKELVR